MTAPPREHDVLREYICSTISLNAAELLALQSLPALAATISPARGQPGLYDITPGSTVGAIRIGGRVIHILPKIPIDRLFFLLSYGVDPDQWWDTPVDLSSAPTVLEAIVPAFAHQVSRALARGLLHGYRNLQDNLTTVRGQICFARQDRLAAGFLSPIECRFDDFTADIIENRLLRAAANVLLRFPLRAASSRAALLRIEHALRDVELEFFDPRRVPDAALTRLNRHYGPALRLSRLILSGASPELRAGAVGCSAFLVDMNVVFEDFIYVALRESLRLTAGQFTQCARGRSLFLDAARRIPLQPDLSWWDQGRCRFVGDVKYKRLRLAGAPNADLYQLLGYLVAADLPSGLLVYAATETDNADHVVANIGKTIHVRAMDISRPPAQILEQVNHLAVFARSLTSRRPAM